MKLQDKEKLKKVDTFIVIEYIKKSIEILVNEKVRRSIEEFMSETGNRKLNSNAVNEYEELLMQAEANNRNHIRIQHQLKLHSENLKYRIEELERSKSELKKNYKLLQEQLNQMKLTDSAASSTKSTSNEKKEKEIKKLTGELENMKTILSSYEQQNAKVAELESKIRTTNLKHEKEMKSLEDKYKEEISYLNKVINKYEEILKTRNLSNTKLLINGGGFNTRDSNIRDRERDKLKNYIEQEEEISPSHFEKQSKLASKNQSPSTERISMKDKNEEFLMKSNKIQNKLETYRKMIENKIDLLNNNKSGKHNTRNNSNDFINAFKFSDRSKKSYLQSHNNMKALFNHLNLSNMNNQSTLKIDNSHTDRMSKSNYSSHVSQRSFGSNNLNNKKLRISQDKLAPSPSFSPDIRLYKPRNVNKDSNIREFYNPKLKSKTQVQSKNVSSHNGSNNNTNLNTRANENFSHIRAKSGFSLNFN